MHRRNVIITYYLRARRECRVVLGQKRVFVDTTVSCCACGFVSRSRPYGSTDAHENGLRRRFELSYWNWTRAAGIAADPVRCGAREYINEIRATGRLFLPSFPPSHRSNARCTGAVRTNGRHDDLSRSRENKWTKQLVGERKGKTPTVLGLIFYRTRCVSEQIVKNTRTSTYGLAGRGCCGRVYDDIDIVTEPVLSGYNNARDLVPAK